MNLVAARDGATVALRVASTVATRSGGGDGSEEDRRGSDNGEDASDHCGK